MNLKEFQKTIEFVGKGIKPNNDWVPVLILECKGECHVIGLIGDFMESQEGKDRLAEVMKKMIADVKPDAACFVSTAWALMGDDAEKAYEQGGMPSENPKRVEVVWCVCAGIAGESDGWATMFGIIERHKDSHPTIKKWETIEEEGTPAQGRFADAIREGFELARGN